MSKINIVTPIIKSEMQDDGRLMIQGVLTSESIDKAGEIIDYASVKKAASEWAGNMREMHQPIAVGKATDIEFNDDEKQVSITAFVSSGAPDTIAKVLDGTLSAFSIGGKSSGRVKEKVAKNDGTFQDIVRVSMARISEASLVDSGCNYDTGFSIVKMADDNDDPDAGDDLDDSEVDDLKVSKAQVADDIKKDIYDVSRFAELIQSLAYTCSSAFWERDYERDNSKVPEKLRDWLTEGVIIFKEMAEEEIDEMMLELSSIGNTTKSEQSDDITKAIDTIKKLLESAENVQKLEQSDDVQKLNSKIEQLEKELEVIKSTPVPLKIVSKQVTVTKEDDEIIKKADIISEEIDRIEKIDNPELKAREMIKLTHKYGATKQYA